VIVQSAQRFAIELGITEHYATFVDECHAVSKCGAGYVGETVRSSRFSPLRSDEPGFASEAVNGLLHHSGVEALIDDENYGDDKYSNDPQAINEEAVCELHAVRGLPLRSL
jgi:hypothetical protein